MYVEKGLKSNTDYNFGRDRNGNPMATVDYMGRRIATLAVPTYNNDVESAQKHIYAVVRSFIRMIDPNNK